MKSYFSILTIARLILVLELLNQLVVLVTESFSNSHFRKFPPSAVLMGYTGQSLLVIIVSILIILMTVLVMRNLGRILVSTAWKISLACMGFSLASISFRVFSAWFVVDSSNPYYIFSYNITSYFIIIGAAVWIPFAFCKSSDYAPETSPVDAERYRITSTQGTRRLFTHRPHQDEEAQSISNGMGEPLPSYYEMTSPPLYKRISVLAGNGNNSNTPVLTEADPSANNETTESDPVHMVAGETLVLDEGLTRRDSTEDNDDSATVRSLPPSYDPRHNATVNINLVS